MARERGHRGGATSSGRLDQLEHHGEGCPVREAPFGSDGSVANGRERALDRVGRSQALPMLGGKVMECQQRLAILAQTFGGLVVLDGVAFDESIEGGPGLGFGFGHRDVLQRALGFRMLALRQPGQQVCRLVDPASLLAGFRPDLAERLPEAERPVGDRKMRRDGEPATFEIEQQLAPIVHTFAGAVGEAEQLLRPFRGRADDDENALRLVFQARLQIDAIGPYVEAPRHFQWNCRRGRDRFCAPYAAIFTAGEACRWRRGRYSHSGSAWKPRGSYRASGWTSTNDRMSCTWRWSPTEVRCFPAQPAGEPASRTISRASLGSI